MGTLAHIVELRAALKEQYHAGLAMLSECIEKCPDDLWHSGEHPRTYCRIVYHTLFFTQLYLGQDERAFQPPPWADDDPNRLWHDPAHLEPYELAEDAVPYNRAQAGEYLRYVDGLIDPTLDSLDLEADATGFRWYPNMSKLSHELMNLRHIQGHAGQLSELLMMRGIDIDWVHKSGELAATKA